MTETLKNLWIKLFGTTEWLGLNVGFWMSMLAVCVLVVVMVVVFWAMKPKITTDDGYTSKTTAAKQNKKSK